MGGFLYEVNEWLLGLGLLALLVAACEAGFRLGRRPGQPISEAAKSQISTVEAGMLGVLALLLGFTMSMAVTRFEVRVQLVLEEADAIGTSVLRTGMLPPAEGAEIAGLLRAYAKLRIPPARGVDIYRQIIIARQDCARLQQEFWRIAVAYGRTEPLRASLLLQSLNEVIDLDAARWMAFQNHVPESIIYAIVLVGVLALLIVGYIVGLDGRRQVFPTSMLALAISLVLVVIIDLDRPHEGFIHVSQQPMIDLQRELSAH